MNIKSRLIVNSAHQTMAQMDLNYHITKVYQNFKPFHCKQSSTKFGQNGRSKLQFNTVHENLKSFHCKLCSSKFGQNEKFMLFDRNICTLKFGTKWGLNCHIKNA
jgi:hypothetical protein